jgi:hypothetical protein
MELSCLSWNRRVVMVGSRGFRALFKLFFKLYFGLLDTDTEARPATSWLSLFPKSPSINRIVSSAGCSGRRIEFGLSSYRLRSLCVPKQP